MDTRHDASGDGFDGVMGDPGDRHLDQLAFQEKIATHEHGGIGLMMERTRLLSTLGATGLDGTDEAGDRVKVDPLPSEGLNFQIRGAIANQNGTGNSQCLPLPIHLLERVRKPLLGRSQHNQHLVGDAGKALRFGRREKILVLQRDAAIGVVKRAQAAQK